MTAERTPESAWERAAAWLSPRMEGVLLPVGTTVLAFLVGGLAVLAAHRNPLTAYKAIFDGTGLNWVLPWTLAATTASSPRSTCSRR